MAGNNRSFFNLQYIISLLLKPLNYRFINKLDSFVPAIPVA